MFSSTSAARWLSASRPSSISRARFAAAIAYIGLINHDRVSLVAFSDGVIEEMPARRGKNQVWRSLHFLERLESSGSTSLRSAFRGFFGARRTRGLVVVISDFLDREGFERSFQVIREYRHDVFAVHVTSPEEVEPVLADEVLLVDSELGQSTRTRVTPDLIKSYRETYARYCAEIETLLPWPWLGIPAHLDADAARGIDAQGVARGRLVAMNALVLPIYQSITRAGRGARHRRGAVLAQATAAQGGGPVQPGLGQGAARKSSGFGPVALVAVPAACGTDCGDPGRRGRPTGTRHAREEPRQDSSWCSTIRRPWQRERPTAATRWHHALAKAAP